MSRAIQVETWERAMNNEQSSADREYVGVIWVADQRGVRLRVEAGSLEDARALVIAKYGEGHVISLWNEVDAASLRTAEGNRW